MKKNIRTATNIEASVLIVYPNKTEARLFFAKNYAALVDKLWDFCFKHHALGYKITKF